MQQGASNAVESMARITHGDSVDIWLAIDRLCQFYHDEPQECQGTPVTSHPCGPVYFDYVTKKLQAEFNRLEVHPVYFEMADIIQGATGNIDMVLAVPPRRSSAADN